MEMFILISITACGCGSKCACTGQVQRGMEMNMLGPYPDTADDQFDVRISDVQPEDLPGRLSSILGTQYLSPVQDTTHQSSVRGAIINTKNTTLRILVTLPVSIRGKSVATHFIFDTGAPRTYLARSVLEALGVPEVSLPSEVVRINGVKTLVSVSDSVQVEYTDEQKGTIVQPCHFVGLNVLGMDFVDRAEIDLNISMKTSSYTAWDGFKMHVAQCRTTLFSYAVRCVAPCSRLTVYKPATPLPGGH
eukprot:354546-Chlamydomonas_euryale.AAC.2